MDSIQENTLEVIKVALWGGELSSQELNWKEIYTVFVQHTIEGLVGNRLNKWSIPSDIKNEWEKRIYSRLKNYYQIVNVQKNALDLLLNQKIPVVVIKGTAASCYYPVPHFRAMGDIDLLVRPDDFKSACAVLKHEGYQDISRYKKRHATYIKNGILIELHWRFGSINELDNPIKFDQIIYDDISLDQTQLSTAQNGLILLEHIVQHSRGGIGLRQIIDWMMYVNQCVDDETWEKVFRDYVIEVGLHNFAITVTRMCQMYLGLRDNIEWCKIADEDLCSEYMDYVLSCGNFGVSLREQESSVITLLPSINQPIKLIRFLQERGKKNWHLGKKYNYLKPFAFIYQGLLYLSIAKKSGFHVIRMNILRRKRKRMFQRLYSRNIKDI